MNIITPDFGILFWQTITFLVTLCVLSKYAWRPIMDALKQREEAIEDSINKISESQTIVQRANEEKVELEKQANIEYEKIIGDAYKIKQEMLEQAQEEGIRARELLLEEAQKEIAQAKRQAEKAIISSAGILAVQIAEKILVKELNQEQYQMELLRHLKAHEDLSV